jgi:NADPH:quinone reductase-like Zn-dependent oxidoreductase
MNAILAREYGSPDRLRLEEVDKPIPADDQVLIRVHAAGLNALNYLLLNGTIMFRPFFGIKRPKDPRVGADVAGVVEAVGRNVTSFKPGDEVFGVARGAIAEFACAPADKIALKPANASFVEAAAMPVAALTALQGLRDNAHLQSGQKVLINGASGGIGTYAVQIAKWMGAEVTGVCSTKNVELVRSIGADHVIDYTRDDFVKHEDRYDIFADIIGNRSLSDCRSVIKPKGTFLNIGVKEKRRLLPRLIGIVALSPFVSQNMGLFMARMTQADLNVLKDLYESKRVMSVIDRTYQLSEAPEALTYLKQGHARGKVVISIR